MTADRETGGLKVLSGNRKGAFPTVLWSTQGHTPVNIPAYAWGVNACRVCGVMENTQRFQVDLGLAPSPPPATRPALASRERGRSMAVSAN